MNKFYLKCTTLALTGFLAGTANAQLQQCKTDELRAEAVKNNPSLLIEEGRAFEFIKKYVREHAHEKDGQVYRIPVVYHVIHQYGTENITDAQLLDQLRIINLDFRHINSDTNQVVPEFKGIAADSKIEFRLATIDPFGNCTNGIERIVSAETFKGGDGARLNPWPRDKYLNIWVNANLGGAAGYATGYDIHMRSDYTGSIGTSGPGGARALTHEIGHIFSLPHIWGNTSPGTVCGDDGVSDTPITKGFSPGQCAQYNNKPAVCNPPIIENIQNYMDYAYCQLMFTQGQADRMRARLNDPNTLQRFLWTPANLAATGVNDTTNKYCAPDAAFYASKDIACVNVPVTFRDNSTKGFVKTRSWSFQDVSTTPGPDSVVTVRFTSPGWKTVTLTVMNDQGSDTETKTKAIFVSSAAVAKSVPYTETFTDGNELGEDWLVKNTEENQTSFKANATYGYSDTKCVMLNSFNSAGGASLKDGNGDVDQLMSPAFNLAGKQGYVISFWLSAASKTSNANNMTEKLTIEASSSCGSSWLFVDTLSKAKLNNGGYNFAAYYPANSGKWQQILIPVTNSYAKDNIRFRFTYTSSSVSNNFFIDDFSIQPGSFMEETAGKIANVNIFPNPINQESQLSFLTFEENKVQMSITDLTGRVVATQDLGQLESGMHNIPMGTATGSLSNGVYMVNVKIGSAVVTRKFVISQ